jgi:ribosomal protein L34E
MLNALGNGRLLGGLLVKADHFAGVDHRILALEKNEIPLGHLPDRHVPSKSGRWHKETAHCAGVAVSLSGMASSCPRTRPRRLCKCGKTDAAPSAACQGAGSSASISASIRGQLIFRLGAEHFSTKP